MLIVFPFSKHDLHLAVPLMAWVKCLGPYPRHDLMLAYSEELTALERETVTMTARDCGWRTPPMAIECKIPVQGWPAAPNAIFAQVAFAVRDFNRPWLFMEPDCTPLAKGWADLIADEYNSNQALPFLGVIEDTYVGLGGSTMQKVGEHLCGCAVYPPNLHAYTQKHRDCANAFDHAIAKDVRPFARNSAVMQDNWSTGNYRREGGQIVSDAVTLRVALSGGSMNRPVRQSVAFLHGCKDGSLIRLLSEKSKITKEITPKMEKIVGQHCKFAPEVKKPTVIVPYHLRRKMKRYRFQDRNYV